MFIRASAHNKVPVVLHTQPGTLRYWKASIFVYIFELVGIAADIDGRYRIGHSGSDQGQLIEMGVSDRRHARPLSGAGRVNLQVDT